MPSISLVYLVIGDLIYITIDAMWQQVTFATLYPSNPPFLKVCAWVVMVAEAVTVIARNTSHFRATRAMRPIFLLDNRYMGGVRRWVMWVGVRVMWGVGGCYEIGREWL